jgi:ABC-type uncharacterized transport system permease subunit
MPPLCTECYDALQSPVPHSAVLNPTIQSLLSTTAAVLYLLTATLIYLRMKALASGIAPGKTIFLVLWSLAVSVHAIALYPHLSTPAGLNLGFFNALSIVALIIAVLVLAASLREATENLGLALLPIAALTLVLDQTIPGPPLIAAELAPGVKMHIIVSLLAYSLLSIAALQAIALGVQDHQLKHRHPGGLIRALPPLAQMDHMLFRFIAAGLLLLSVALITGAAYLDDIFAQHLVHKTVLSIVAWVVFAVLLIGHWKLGWRGAKASRWTLGGFLALMLAYFGSKFVLELVLARTV